MYNAARSTANQTCFFDDDETSDDDLYQSDESSDDPQSGDNFSGSASDEDFGFGSTPKMSSLVHALNISYEDMNDYEDEDDFHAQDLPHWFSNEAPDQVRLIISKYSRILHIDRLRESSVRAPKPFIGRIRRTPVKTADNTFKTLDQIDIFINDFVPMGQELPLKSSESVLTTWDAEMGLPGTMEKLPEKHKVAEWKTRRVRKQPQSFLLCLPVALASPDFSFSVSSQKDPIRHACAPFTYDRFIPECLRQSQGGWKDGFGDFDTGSLSV